MKKSIYSKIRRQMLILAAVTAVLFAAIIITEFVVIRQTVLRVNSELGESAAEDARQMLIEHSEEELFGIVKYKAALSDNYFDTISTDVRRMVYAAQGMLAYPGPTEHQKMEILRGMMLENIQDSIKSSGGGAVYYGTEAGTLYYVDTTGHEIPVNTDMTGRPWYTAAKEAGELIWTDLFDDAYGRGLSITCAMPYYAPNGTLAGVAGAGMAITGIIELVVETIGETGQAFMLNENGQIIIAENMQADQDGNPIRENLLESLDETVRRAAQRMINGESGIERVTMQSSENSVERFIVFHPLESMPWSLAVFIDIDEIIAPAHLIENSIHNMKQSAIDSINRDMFRITSMAWVILALVILGVTYLSDRMAKDITMPIRKMTEDAGIIGEGKLDYTMEIKTGDELEVLADSFNSMISSIKTVTIEKITAEAVANAMRDNLLYASSIQRNLLPSETDMEKVFSDSSVIWKPRDIVGGDIYWIKKFDIGTVLCVCDCTGHGTPGALLTMLVISTLESIVNFSNCNNTDDLVMRLDDRLSKALHAKTNDERRHGIMDIKDGCDIAILFISKYGDVKFSTGKVPVFVCNGKEVSHYKGQKLFIGEGKLKSIDEVKVVSIPANPDNKFYIASDGLFEQIGGKEGIQYGYDMLKRIILDNHNEKLSVITDEIWKEFETYRGNEPQRDDFELVAFAP